MDSQEQGTNLDSPWLSPLILTYLISWVYYLKFYLYMQFPLGKKNSSEILRVIATLLLPGLAPQSQSFLVLKGDC